MAGASHRCAVREGIDMNSEPAPAEEEEEEEAAGGASPRSGASSVVNGDTKGSISDEEEDGTEGTRKKLRLSKEQSAVLEETFRVHVAPNTTRKAELAKQLNLRTRQVEVWFQNRRARIKLKQTGVTCDFLKKRCEMLEEENRRLVSEVQQLRSLKLFPPQLYMARPPTAVPVCLSCQREPPSLPSPPGHRPLHSYPIPKLMPRGIPARPWTEPGKSCDAKTCNSDTPREEMKGCTVYPLKKGEIFIFKKDEKEMGGENGPTAPESSTRKRSREFV